LVGSSTLLGSREKERKKERKKSATLLSYKPLSKCLSRLGALHVDIICKWVVGVTKVAIQATQECLEV